MFENFQCCFGQRIFWEPTLKDSQNRLWRPFFYKWIYECGGKKYIEVQEESFFSCIIIVQNLNQSQAQTYLVFVSAKCC